MDTLSAIPTNCRCCFFAASLCRSKQPFCKLLFGKALLLRIVVLDNVLFANNCSRQLFSKLSLRATILQIVTLHVLLLLNNFLQVLQIVVRETSFANYTNQCSGQFICKVCKLSLRPGYSLFASCTTCCSGHFVYKFLQIIVPVNFFWQKSS